jgi:hypothetical protein
MGRPQESLGHYDLMHFFIEIQAVSTDGLNHLVCNSEAKCRVKFQRSYTPILYYLSPPVVYYEAEIQLHFDPKSIMNLIKDVESDNLPFV